MVEYDYLIVGAGLFGSVFANEASKKGLKCLVIDKRSHIGGNVYTENIEGINVHKYGAHIFHTNDEFIWNYINQFATFNNYVNSPIALSQGKLYNLPFNMNTFHQIWGVKTPAEAKNIINEQIKEFGTINPANLKEQALSLVGKDIFDLLIKEYTEKQWGTDCEDLPSFIIKRLPLRYTFDNNYFNDKYQGIPEGGYSPIIDKLLKGSDVKLNVDFFKNKKELSSLAKKIVYTGKLDEFFDYQFGYLEYRSLRFENEILEIENFQGNAVVNYIDKEIEYTRIIEHKHFEFGKQLKTIITKEYPEKWDENKEAYYPINNELNQRIYKQYQKLKKNHPNTIFGGRLAEYRYYDMHQVIASALKIANTEL